MKLLKLLTVLPILSVLLFFACETEQTPSVAPTIQATFPANNAIDISKFHVVEIEFSEAMDARTISSSSVQLKSGENVIDGEFSMVDNTASFTPSTPLDANTTYTVLVNTSARNNKGIAIADNYSFTFTTSLIDVTAPTVVAMSPPADAVGVGRRKMIFVKFSEPMDSATVNKNTFMLKIGDLVVPGTVSYSGVKGYFYPKHALRVSTTYTATLTTGAKDMSGNALASDVVWSFETREKTPLAVVNLGSANNYLILAKTAINVGATSALTGDIGLSPAATSFITGLSLIDATGFATSSQVVGNVYAADMADPTPINLTTAVNDMITAYNDAAGRPTPDFSELLSGNIGGETLKQGLYKWSGDVIMPGNVTISGGPNDVWIFQIAGNLHMSNGMNITLVGGAQAKNIFWQVAGEATIEPNAHFEGILLSMTGITLQTGASFKGLMLAQTAVILDQNAVIRP